jgi:hypothetical protein
VASKQNIDVAACVAEEASLLMTVLMIRRGTCENIYFGTQSFFFLPLYVTVWAAEENGQKNVDSEVNKLG